MPYFLITLKRDFRTKLKAIYLQLRIYLRRKNRMPVDGTWVDILLNQRKKHEIHNKKKLFYNTIET